MKKFIRLFLLLLYLGAAVISSLILVKPGAAIFFIKSNIERNTIVKDAGMSYRYRLDVDPHLIRTQGIQVYENGQLIALSRPDIVTSSGNGTYAISTSSEGITYIYFSATDNSDPITNGRTYTLYLPLTLVSRPLALVYLILLLPLIVRLIDFALAQKEHGQLMTRSPTSVLNVLDRFFDRSLPSIPADIQRLWQEKSEGNLWKRLFTTLVLVSYFYIFMEWLFFATMPSFMSLTSFFNKVEVFMLSGLAFFIFCFVATMVFTLLDMLAAIAYKGRIIHYLELFIPSIALSSLGCCWWIILPIRYSSSG